MISSGMVACHPDNEGLRAEIRDRRNALRDRIASKLHRWMDGREAASLARYLAALTQGISIQARDGATAEDLAMIVDEAVASLEARGRKAPPGPTP